jgi:hypothetical protein
MCSIVRKRLPSENMSRFSRSPQFAREFERFSKKYPSLEQDLRDLEDVLRLLPCGSGKNFTILYHAPEVKIVKVRLACKSLRDRSMRLIYAYHDSIEEFLYIELYSKGDKSNEDRERIKEYLQGLG